MPRIPYPDPDQLSEAKRAVLNGKGPVLNLTRMAMHMNDQLWPTYRHFAIAGRDQSPLEDQLRELAILRVGHLSNSAYEVHHHLHVAEAAGASPEKLEAVKTGDLAALDPRERAVIQFVTELVRDVEPSDATLAAVREYFSIEEVFGIFGLVTGYMTTARLVGIAGLELDGNG